MSIFAISDLHLSFGVEKPMNVFGKIWDNYEDKIKENWIKKVKENDTVIIPGDISWGMTLNETKNDFSFINSLPGKKLIMKGNHNYYFSTKTKLDKFFKENNFDTLNVLYNNAYDVEDYIICGTRGWGKIDGNSADLTRKIIRREEIRLKISLEEAKKIQEYYNNKNITKKIIVAMHFPPFTGKFEEILNEYNVYKCIYGHLHGYGHSMIKEGKIKDVIYIMVSCDYTNFDLIRLD